MVKLFLKIYDFFSGRRWMPIIMSLFVIVFCLRLAFHIDYEEDISAFLPVDNSVKEYTKIYSEIGGQDQIAVIFSGEIERVIPAMDYFGEQLTKTDTSSIVKSLQVTIDENRMQNIMAEIWQIYPLLLKEEDYIALDSLLKIPGYVANQMDRNQQLLMMPISGIMTQSLPYDPLQISSKILSDLKNSSWNNHYQIIEGHLFSKNGSKGIVLLSSGFGISESKQNERLVNLLESVSDSTKKAFEDITVSYIGAPVIAVENATQIKKDSILAVILSIVLIISILYYSFRNWIDIGWIGISIVFGWIFALGSLALLNNVVSIIVLGIGSVIIGIAANYPLHYLDHMKQEPQSREVLKEMVPPLLIGNITTVSAFLCLVFIDAKAMLDLGVFGSMMLVGTILFVLVFLPSLVQSKKHKPKPHYILPELTIHFDTNLKKGWLIIVVLCTVVFSYFSVDTKFDSDIQHINYMTKEQQADLKFLSTSLEANDSISTLFLVTQGETFNQALYSLKNS